MSRLNGRQTARLSKERLSKTRYGVCNRANDARQPAIRLAWMIGKRRADIENAASGNIPN